jgi:hypothetical protein
MNIKTNSNMKKIYVAPSMTVYEQECFTELLCNSPCGDGSGGAESLIDDTPYSDN